MEKTHYEEQPKPAGRCDTCKFLHATREGDGMSHYCRESPPVAVGGWVPRQVDGKVSIELKVVGCWPLIQDPRVAFCWRYQGWKSVQ